MKLYCNPISPYARKVMILARLKNIELEEITAVADGANGYTSGLNPLGKIPALEWKAGEVLFGSSVICQYLDGLSGAPILPAHGPARFTQLKLHALGDGLADAAYNRRYEIVRPAELHWDKIIARHDAAMTSTIAALEDISDELGAPWCFGNLAIICALDYMTYRAGHIDWRGRAPKLKLWHDGFKLDPFYQETDIFSDTNLSGT